jgi:hypothetical protein
MPVRMKRIETGYTYTIGDTTYYAEKDPDKSRGWLLAELVNGKTVDVTPYRTLAEIRDDLTYREGVHLGQPAQWVTPYARGYRLTKGDYVFFNDYLMRLDNKGRLVIVSGQHKGKVVGRANLTPYDDETHNVTVSIEDLP